MTRGQRDFIKSMILGAFILIALVMIILSGCSRKNPTAPSIKSTVAISEITPPYKLLCIGNSITYHPEYHGAFDWPGNWGMAAETQSQDYVHQLHVMLETYLQQSVGLEFTNCAIGFELDFWERGAYQFTDYYDTDANIIVLFFSDNTSMVNFDLYYYENFYDQVIKRFVRDDRIVVCVTNWFEDNVTPEQKEQKDSAIKRSCSKNGIPWVDINGLYSENNYINCCFGEGRSYNNIAVDCHPGNHGMQRIAEKIFDILKNVLP